MSDLKMTNQNLSQSQSMEELANQLTLADHLVYKKYLPELQNYSLVEPSEEMKETLDVKTCIKLFQMKELTLKKGEDVTVLEEAHNLLRKTSAEQSQESANVQGKSVEMLANAIAEMRTYGEGFIIADQAPGLLDVSVIRNTNTKIILRLPDEEDRKLVGKSAGLKEAQIDELSKLPLGVAAVYQNEWPEAVLCKVKAYPVPEGAVYHKPVKTEEEINTEFIFGQLAQEAPAKCLNDSETEQLKRWLKRHEIWIEPEERRYIEQVFRGELKDRDKTQKMVFDFFDGMETLIQYCYEAEKTLTPRRELVNQLQGRYALQTSTAEWALNCLMTEGLQRNPDRDAAKELRKNFLEQGGKVM